MLALTVAIVLLPIDYSALGNYGYLGVFGVTLLATAAIVVPVPYLAIIFEAGKFLDPVLVGLIAGLAAAIGEFTGYVLGRSGRALMPDNRWYRMVEQAMARFGIVVIFVGAAIPNPFFDAMGVVAGATRMPIWKFAAPCFVGKALRFWLFAALGGSLPFL
jgi:membrane protein YqaA with SNARE-associated domain